MTGSVLYFLTSGLSFFTGLLFVIICFPMSSSEKTLLVLLHHLLFIVGIIFILVSNTPAPFVLYFFFLCFILAFIIFSSVPRFKKSRNAKFTVSLGITLTSLLLFLFELPYTFSPEILVPNNTVYILGDSLTAGLGDKSTITYPKLINEKGDFTITDLSVAGSKVNDGILMAHGLSDEKATVLVELGGNDWRSNEPDKIKEYRRGLDNLLSLLNNGQRQVVLFELPFPPFDFGFSYTQRRLARKHGVILIPRRFLSYIFFYLPKSRVVGLHLSQVGHDNFADKLYPMLGQHR